MRLSHLSVIVSMGALAACSSSDESSGGGGNPPDTTRSPTVESAFALLQGELDSKDQAPDNGYVPPTPRRTLGCVVNAPELGDRVIYLERKLMDGTEALDRQLLLSLTEDLDSGPLRSGIATIHRLAQPDAWVGGCATATEIAPLSAVEPAGEACFFTFSMNDSNGQLSFSGGQESSGGQMPAACALPSPGDVAEIAPLILLENAGLYWRDSVIDTGGVSTTDPANPDGSATPQGAFYRMARRTAVVEPL